MGKRDTNQRHNPYGLVTGISSGSYGNLRTRELMDRAQTYVEAWYESDDPKDLNSLEMFSLYHEIAKRIIYVDLQGLTHYQERAENAISHSLMVMYRKLQKKEIAANRTGWYYTKVIRSKVMDVMRGLSKGTYNTEPLESWTESEVDESMYKRYHDPIAELDEVIQLERTTVMLVSYIKSQLREVVHLRGIRGYFLIPVILTSAIHNHEILIKRYPFRVRLILRGIIDKARKKYLDTRLIS